MVAEDNLTVVYLRPDPRIQYGCFQALVVVFSQAGDFRPIRLNC